VVGVTDDEPDRPDEEARAVLKGQFKPEVVDPEAKAAEARGETGASLFMGGDNGENPYASDDTPDPTPSSATAETTTRQVGLPESALPLGQLGALDPQERQRAAQQRGVEWPTTREARDELFATLTEVMAEGDDRVVDAPTALGKSYSMSATDWGEYGQVTGDRPVVHLSETRDARDEAWENAQNAGTNHLTLLARHEACPIAAGDHDPQPEDDDGPEQPITVDGEPASEWLAARCRAEGDGIHFSDAHRRLEAEHDQGLDTLPCCEDGGCYAIDQWRVFREGDHDLVLGTHNFAHVPGLRAQTNVVIDEQPDFALDMPQERIRRAVTAFLNYVDADVRTFERLVEVGKHGLRPNEHDPRGFDKRWDDLRDQLDTEPEREWYYDVDDAHMMAPALARALLGLQERANDRYATRVPFKPPRLDKDARDGDAWAREFLSLVVTEDNDVVAAWSTPDFTTARSLIGLDAHPAEPIWQLQTAPWITAKQVLDPQDRRLWRRFERGLRVVQVGEATRPLSGDRAGEWFSGDKVRALAEHLHERYGEEFHTGITTAQVEDRFQTALDTAGCHGVETMHYGAEKSRNDFAGERVGLVNGCMDPGDGLVVDVLAALDLEAEPETNECPQCDGTGCPTDDDCHDGARRAHGRAFVGEDAGIAQAILASVRENHVAQAAGRYARDADDPEDAATVYVRTDAAPAGFVDVQVPDVAWTFADLQSDIVEELRSAERPQTARAIATAVGCSKEHVRQTLERLRHRDEDDTRESYVQAFERAGDHGATLYADDGVPNAGVAELPDVSLESANDHVLTPITWSLAIRPPGTVGDGDDGRNGGGLTPLTGAGDWRAAGDPGG
jgi:hypothetical protein